MQSKQQIAEATQARAKIVDDVCTFLRLAKSAHESILLGDYAQGLGNLESLSSLRVELVIACSKKVREEHAAVK